MLLAAGDVGVAVVGKNAADSYDFGLQSPASVLVCHDCGGGESADLGVYPAGTALVFYLTDLSFGQTFSSTDPNHAIITQDTPTQWTISWDDAFGDRDFNDLIVTVTVGAANQLPTLGDLLGGGSPADFCWRCFGEQVLSDFVSLFPVDAETGDFWHTFDDLSIPGRGVPLSLARTYNSLASAINSPFGFGWSFNYSMDLVFPDAGTAVVNQENGSTVTFVKQVDGGYLPPTRSSASLTHNTDDSWTFTRRARQIFDFDNTGRLVKELDLNGYVTALAYDTAGQLSSVTDAAGRSLRFTWTGANITSVTDPLDRTVTYRYDETGNLTDVTDVAGGDTHFAYDTEHHVVRMRWPNQAPGVGGATGALITNTYDSQGLVTAQSDQLGRTTTFAYSGDSLSAGGGTTTVTDPKGNVTVQTYTGGVLVAQTEGAGTSQAATWQFTHDPATLGVTQMIDPDGHKTKSTYDAQGNPLTTTDALGRTTTDTYDALNDLVTTTDPNAVTITMAYDVHGNLLSTSTPLVGTTPRQTQTTIYSYGDAGHTGDVTAMTGPDGQVTHYRYDADGDVASVTDPAGDTTSYGYNQIGWGTQKVSPKGNVKGANATAFTNTIGHDNFGQVTTTVDPLGGTTTNSYDRDQNLTSVTDADGNQTTYTFDAADQETATHRADGTFTQTTYWPDGTIEDQIDGAGNTTHYDYDPQGRLSAVTDPLGHVISYGYDPAGNNTTITDPQGQVTTISYDADNEQTAIDYSDRTTPDVTGIGYDADGQRTTMTDGTGTWTWTWDSLHRLTQVTEGNQGTVGYHYDLRNLPTMIVYPGNHAVTQGYDADGRSTTLTDWLGNTTTFGYDPDSNLSAETLPASTAVSDAMTYDDADRLTSITDTNLSPLGALVRSISPTLLQQLENRLGAGLFRQAFAIFGYQRDPDNQVITDSSAPQSQDSYQYDALNQLCYAAAARAAGCAMQAASAEPFRYDTADNLTQLGATTQRFNAADQLCWTGHTTISANCSAPPPNATRYHYDANGDLTNIAAPASPATTLGYDQDNRLTSYTNSTTSATYTYNGDGLRMTKTVAAATTGFTWDPTAATPNLLQEETADGTTDYLYGPGGLPVEQISPTGVNYYQHDQLGSTRAITNSAGTVQATYTYDPYGNLIKSTGTITNPFRYAGQYTDPESGLIYLRSRYYDPATGQFVTRDRAESMSHIAYGYASNNPENDIDPTGTTACTASRPCVGPGIQTDKNGVPYGNAQTGAILCTTAGCFVKEADVCTDSGQVGGWAYVRTSAQNPEFDWNLWDQTVHNIGSSDTNEGIDLGETVDILQFVDENFEDIWTVAPAVAEFAAFAAIVYLAG